MKITRLLFMSITALFLFGCSQNISDEYRGNVYSSDTFESNSTYSKGKIIYGQTNVKKVFLHFLSDGSGVNLHNYWVYPNGRNKLENKYRYKVTEFNQSDDEINVTLKIEPTQMVLVGFLEWDEKETPSSEINNEIKLKIKKPEFVGNLQGSGGDLDDLPEGGIDIAKCCDQFNNSSKDPNCNPEEFMN